MKSIDISGEKKVLFDEIIWIEKGIKSCNLIPLNHKKED